MIEIKFKLELISDAEPASGFGTELFDSLVPRNSNGKVHIPASHIKGLMRDSLKLISNSLNHNGLSILIDRVFGTPGGLGTGSSALFVLSDLEVEKVVKTKAVSRTAINEYGTAKNTSLRTAEAIPAGTVFNGCLKTICQSSTAVDLLLRLALTSTMAIGGNRNRGCGACRIEIENENRTPGMLLRELAVAQMDTIIEPAQGKNTRKMSAVKNSKEVALRLTFNTNGSICLPDLPIVGTNTIRSGFAIPASAVQGMVLHRLNRLNSALADRCYSSSSFRAWPLLPQELDTLGLPVRASATHKISKLPDTNGNYTFRDEIIEKYDWQSVPAGAPLKAADGVLLPGKQGVKLWCAHDMARLITAHAVHNDPLTGRNFFTVESLSGPLIFGGMVIMPADAADLFLETLEEDSFVQLGKARSIRGGGTLKAAPENLADMLFFSDGETARRAFIVQSPLLIPEGSVNSCADEQLSKMVADSGWGEVEQSSASTSVLFGWNQHTLGKMVGKNGRMAACRVISPGSVFLLKNPISEIESLVLQGIGKGREQGLGAVLPHPGIAKSRLEIKPKLLTITNTDQSGRIGYQLWETAAKCGLSASQIGAVLAILSENASKAIEYVDRQKTDRPDFIWDRWKTIRNDIKSQIMEDPKQAEKALKVCHDLLVWKEAK